LERCEHRGHRVRAGLRRDEARADRVAAEDVREPGGDARGEAEVLQRPYGVLTRCPAAEVVAGDEDLCARGAGPVEREVRVAAPGAEQAGLEAGPLHPL